MISIETSLHSSLSGPLSTLPPPHPPTPIPAQMVFEAETKCRHELQAMRERHRERFLEATAKLRSQHKTLAKRAKALEQQLAKNSVSPLYHLFSVAVGPYLS